MQRKCPNLLDNFGPLHRFYIRPCACSIGSRHQEFDFSFIGALRQANFDLQALQGSHIRADGWQLANAVLVWQKTKKIHIHDLSKPVNYHYICYARYSVLSQVGKMQAIFAACITEYYYSLAHHCRIFWFMCMKPGQEQLQSIAKSINLI